MASVAKAAGLPRDAIRNILEGHDPKLSRVIEVAAALGLDFYVGPPRAVVPVGVARALGLRDDCTPQDAVRAIRRLDSDAVNMFVTLLSESRQEAFTQSLLEKLVGEIGELVADPASWNKRRSRYIAVPFAREVYAVSGDVTYKGISGERPRVRKTAVPIWASEAELILVEVPDDSMTPTLRDGDYVLLDRSKTTPIVDRMFLVGRGRGATTIRRVNQIGPVLVLSCDSDDQSHPPLTLDHNTRVAAQVVLHGVKLSSNLSWRSDRDTPRSVTPPESVVP